MLTRLPWEVAAAKNPQLTQDPRLLRGSRRGAVTLRLSLGSEPEWWPSEGAAGCGVLCAFLRSLAVKKVVVTWRRGESALGLFAVRFCPFTAVAAIWVLSLFHFQPFYSCVIVHM